MMSRLFGDWKKPKPRPHGEPPSEAGLGSPILSATRTRRPTAITNSPMLPRSSGMKRSARRPAIGAMTAVARQGQIRSPRRATQTSSK